MAREYNAKYGKANVLKNNSIDGFNNLDSFKESGLLNEKNFLTKDKEKIKDNLEKDFEDLSSLFLFVKKHIARMGATNVNKWWNFYLGKLNEIEKKVDKLKRKIDLYL